MAAGGYSKPFRIKIFEGANTMERTPLVSIIVPVYNQERYLDAAYDCLAAQSYQNLEFVMVNDGSTDASAQMLQGYAKRDNRVKIVEKANGGLVDATLSGISAATGEFICFLDPDDLLGSNHIRFFMDLMTEDCDFVAAGIYEERMGVLTPIYLKEDRIYSEDELRAYSNTFFYEPGEADGLNRFFNSRWNKFYRTELVKEIAPVFSEFKHISLGEDTLFTYLALRHSRGGRTVRCCNSYFYNVANMNSMTKNEKVDQHLAKSKAVFEALKSLTERYGTDVSQAYALYENQINVLYARLPSKSDPLCDLVRAKVEKDPVYQKALELRGQKRWKTKLKSMLRQMTPVIGAIRDIRAGVGVIKQWGGDSRFWIEQCVQKGPSQATGLLRLCQAKRNDSQNPEEQFDLLEKRLMPILTPWLSKQTDLNACPAEKNIFVFRWDGFREAHSMVDCCLKSIRRWYPEYDLILISKENIENYTDIDAEIYDAFSMNNISEEMFENIIRFNVLKNNGGMWIDASVFVMSSDWDLIPHLAEKSFSSLAYTGVERDFAHDGATCSWTTGYMASRKNGVFVSAIDAAVKAYYQTYHTFSTTMFMDHLLRICKKHGMDGAVLDKTLRTNRSMEALSYLLTQPFDAKAIEFMQGVPQKLYCNEESIPAIDTYYGWVMGQ